jgi:WD40 repeat protein/tRNA A-37 threonylcarbamoyl transferase component Bud32
MDDAAKRETKLDTTISITEATLMLPPAEPVLAFFGDYTILGEIAAGGMGVVYHARQRRLNRTVALKMIRAGALAKEEEIRRFRIEAEAAANLDHPNIVPIYELGECDGRHYFSMKLVAGRSLAEFNTQCPARTGQWFQRAAGLMTKIALAVQHAHDRGVLHRDLKPQNILIDESGEPHVTDFGLAKLLDKGSSETIADAIMGTPKYMAPEQASGRTRDVTTAADVYSLGAILFALLAGDPPFHGGSVMEILEKVRSEPAPDPTTLNPAVPKDLATICLKCLEKEPPHRYPSARALAEEINRWLAGEPIQARPTTTLERSVKWVRRNPRLAAALGLALVSALAGFSGVTWQWQRAERQSLERQRLNARLQIERAEDFFTQHNPSAGLATLARVLRDDPANRVAAARIVNRLHLHRTLTAISQPLGAGAALAGFLADGRVWVAGTNAHGWVVTIQRPGQPGTELALPHGENRILAVAVTRDGRLTATGCESGARLWSAVDGRLLREFRWDSVVPYVNFREAPGGSQLIAATSNAVFLCSTETGETIRHYTAGSEAVVIAIRSSDSRRLGVATEDGTVRLRALDLDGDWIAIPNAHRGVIRSLAFSEDGRWLVTAASDRFARIWNVDSGKLVHSLPAEDSVVHATFNATGTLVVSAARNGIVQTWDALTGQPAFPALTHPKAVNSARFSPDGRWILTACDDGVARLWSAQNGRLAASTPTTTRQILDAAFNTTGSRLLTLNDGASALLWTILGGTGAEPRSLEAGAMPGQLAARQSTLPADELARYSGGHQDLVVYSDATSNGWFAATASRDRTARLWNRRLARLACDPLLHDATVNCVHFSADGATLATSTSSRRMRLWDTATGQPITDWITSSRPVARVWISPDDLYLVTADGEVWSIYAQLEIPPLWLPSLAEAVAGQRYRDDPSHVSESVSPGALAAVQREVVADAGTKGAARENWIYTWARQLLHGSESEQSR